MAELQESELEIQQRGQAVERKWLSPAHQETRFGMLLRLCDEVGCSNIEKLSFKTLTSLEITCS